MVEKQKSIWREYAEAIGMALVLALFVRTFIVQAFKIPSGSMIPTLLVGDHLLVNKFIYRFRDPRRGEVVVFKYPQDGKTDFIKRVIAVGGEKVEVKERKVFINDKPLEENFAYYFDSREDAEITLVNSQGVRYSYRDLSGAQGVSQKSLAYGPYTVPAGKVLVMGDNRDNSYDSRFWGPVDVKKVVGEALFIYWSWGDSIFDIRWRRIGDIIH